MNVSSVEVFEAISHPMRLDILKTLARGPMGFADLKRKLRISSSRFLDFHLKKMKPIVVSNQDGCYSLNTVRFAALYDVEVVLRKGWQKRSLMKQRKRPRRSSDRNGKGRLLLVPPVHESPLTQSYALSPGIIRVD